MSKTTIRFSTFPRTEPPPSFTSTIVDVFKQHESLISTERLSKGVASDIVLGIVRGDLVTLGFDVEGGKQKAQKIERPVFFGENGIPTVRYQIDAYHTGWECGLEIEAGRAWMGNAVFRDLIQACAMVQVRFLVLAISNAYKYMSSGRQTVSEDYQHAIRLADSLYGHSRFRLPYDLILIGY